MIKMISGIVITLSFLIGASVVIANQHILENGPDLSEDHHSVVVPATSQNS